MSSATQIVSDRDKATRAAALGTLEVAYLSEGQAIWSKLGRLSDQQHSLIEERFKYTDKQVRSSNHLIRAMSHLKYVFSEARQHAQSKELCFDKLQ